MKAGPLHLLLLALTPLFLLCAPGSSESASITDYRHVFQYGGDSSGAKGIAIRKYRKDGVPYLLLVDPFSFEISAVTEASFRPGGAASSGKSSGTPYVKALDRYSTPPDGLQNHGLIHAEYPVTGIFLTIDMCPSVKPFEKAFFATLADISLRDGRAAPVAIAITGKWLQGHGDELAWLVGKIREGKLAVTWVNHSATHPYDPGAPLERNFLLTPGIDFDWEVLETERLLLENGLLPSPFFRFPGLVADGKLIEKLRKLALIPVGSDAWLAKGELPKNGSIVLVHGNGNESPGIRMALRLLNEQGGAKLLPLREAFAMQ